MHLYEFYIVAKFQSPSFNTSRDMNFFHLIFGQVTDGQMESDAYEPTLHKHRWAQKRGEGLTLKMALLLSDEGSLQPRVRFCEGGRGYLAIWV